MLFASYDSLTNTIQIPPNAINEDHEGSYEIKVILEDS